MRRRTLLAAAGAGAIPLASCLSTTNSNDTDPETPTESEDRRYDECPGEVIPYDQFPAKIQAEIDAALDGRYEANRVYLSEAMAVDESYVSVDDTYYDPSVTIEADRERLELDTVEPKALPDPRPVSVEHNRNGERTISITLTADDGTVLVDETRALYPGGDVAFGSTRRVGSHELRVTVSDGDKTEAEFEEPVDINESRFSVLVLIENDGISVGGTVASLAVCQFDGTEDMPSAE